MKIKGDYKIDEREKTIFRVNHDKDNPYVIINREPITNPKLSFKAKGILAYLLSRPDGWEVNVPDLVNHSTDGPAAVRSGLRELREAKHIIYNPKREGGFIKKWVIEVYESPLKVIPPDVGGEEAETDLDSDFRNVGNSLDCDFLHEENLQVGNRREVLKNLNNNEFKQTSALSKNQIEKANKQVDYMVKSAQDTAKWPGREKMPEAITDLLDVFVEITGMKPSKSQLTDWLSTGQEWLDMGIKESDLREAYKKSKGPEGKIGGFLVNRPGSLTNTAGAIAGERRLNEGFKKKVIVDPMSRFNEYLERRENAPKP